jgi:hypothetical protein
MECRKENFTSEGEKKILCAILPRVTVYYHSGLSFGYLLGLFVLEIPNNIDYGSTEKKKFLKSPCVD